MPSNAILGAQFWSFTMKQAAEKNQNAVLPGLPTTLMWMCRPLAADGLG